ncbi:DUF190 domain-containing protein [Dyella tabacisoli]|uniref:DUF190 domain-containing protein n=1 Tax=Dyella tabacisoli TaxID=2282381 RepID=A0A369UQ50_9GAMM|nr:DUF190 domain-containing protein [Dyella tabacisoli]
MQPQVVQQGLQLSFYCHQRARHNGSLVFEWLLQQARHLGIGGGSVFRATAGFGRHGVLHQEQFFDLADDLPVKVEFLLHEEQAQTLLEAVQSSGVDVLYVRIPVSFAVLGKL